VNGIRTYLREIGCGGECRVDSVGSSSSSITMELDYTILVAVSYPRGFLEITFS
jgi:hypothetical protein